jgi:hypothetical protein
MSHRSILARLAAAPLLIAALAAPPALAVSLDPQTGAPHAESTAPIAEQGRRDIAAAYRADAAAQRPARQDARSENTTDPSRAPVPPAGLPVSAGDDDSVVPVLAIGGTLLLGAGLAAGRVRGRRVRPA